MSAPGRYREVRPGNTYGQWTVGALCHPFAVCTCACGTVRPVYMHNLLYGLSKSCGSCGARAKAKGRGRQSHRDFERARLAGVVVAARRQLDALEQYIGMLEAQRRTVEGHREELASLIAMLEGMHDAVGGASPGCRLPRRRGRPKPADPRRLGLGGEASASCSPA